MANISIGDLPDLMLSEILVRLPVKSLLICKSVCKPWLHTISTPHFVKLQFRRATIASTNNPTPTSIQSEPAKKMGYRGLYDLLGLPDQRPNLVPCDVLFDSEKKEGIVYSLPKHRVSAPMKYIETLVSLDGFVPAE